MEAEAQTSENIEPAMENQSAQYCARAHFDLHYEESDTSEGIVELEADEIPGYFQERGGRLFHSHGSCPYPLPVDAEEQQVSQPGVSRAHVTVRPGR